MHQQMKLLRAKTGSPIVIGEGEDGLYIASDASGILKTYKKNVISERPRDGGFLIKK